MKHLDLFSGIGGFAYAADNVFDNVEHIFCDNDKFCQKILKKHWSESLIYDDIRSLTTNTTGKRLHDGIVNWEERQLLYNKNRISKENQSEWERWIGGIGKTPQIDILTGGFPCQPFSQAGKRKGTNDDRYLWPEMLRVIQEFNPTWIIAENVRGLLTIEGGMVFEQVCLDLEGEGYEVQPLIIPACAVNAPHRRDRVWIIANKPGERLEGSDRIQEKRCAKTDWEKDWLEVATRLCRVDDGIPDRMDRLKSLGNAIVPQVAMQIMMAIKYALL